MAKKKKKSCRIHRLWIFVLASIALFLGAIAIALSVSNTKFEEPEAFFVVEDLNNVTNVIDRLKKEEMIVSRLPCYAIAFVFHTLLGKEIYPGKYRIERGASTWKMFKDLYTGKQHTIKVIINKFRLWGDFVGYLKSKIPIDSAEFTNEFAKLARVKTPVQFPEQLFSYVLPDTYYFFWTSSAFSIAQKLYANYVNFWNQEERLLQLKRLGLSKEELFIIASLVEEETNRAQDKPLIASVFINRYKKRMYLGSCPSVKFSLKDFALKRILFKHLKAKSPYNTYRNLGLPPSPICTPSTVTLDATLDAPETDYLYFVADSEDLGKHLFSKTYEQHLAKARIYVNKIFTK